MPLPFTSESERAFRPGTPAAAAVSFYGGPAAAAVSAAAAAADNVEGRIPRHHVHAEKSELTGIF